MSSALCLCLSLHLASLVVVPSLASILYECNEFDLPDLCGTNVNKVNSWIVHETYNLYNIPVNLDDIDSGYLLYVDGANNSIASYQLNVPSQAQMSLASSLCVEYETLVSQHCHTDATHLCSSNVTLVNSYNRHLPVEANKHMTFDDDGWCLQSYQFSLDRTVNATNLAVVLNGFVLQRSHLATEGDKYTSDWPYIVVRSIEVTSGECVGRIGRRKAFWIISLVLFTMVAGYTFVHIVVRHIQHEHQKRTQQRHPVANISTANKV